MRPLDRLRAARVWHKPNRPKTRAAWSMPERRSPPFPEKSPSRRSARAGKSIPTAESANRNATAPKAEYSSTVVHRKRATKRRNARIGNVRPSSTSNAPLVNHDASSAWNRIKATPSAVRWRFEISNTPINDSQDDRSSGPVERVPVRQKRLQQGADRCHDSERRHAPHQVRAAFEDVRKRQLAALAHESQFVRHAENAVHRTQDQSNPQRSI